MPKVPGYQTQVQTRTETAIQPQQAPVVEAAFGGQVAAATANLGNQVQKTGEILGQRFIEMQKRDDEVTLLKTQAAFQTDLQNTLNNPEADENGRAKGFLSRNFSSAKGSTVEFDQVAPMLKQKYMETAVGPDMQRMLDKALTTHLSSARDQISKNEANQLDADFRATTDDAVKGVVQQAALLDDPVHLQDHIALGQETTARALKQMGYSDARIAFANQRLAGDAVKAAVIANLDKDPNKARALFEANKAAIPGNYQAEIATAIDGKIVFEQRNALWKQAESFVLPGGEADEKRQAAFIDAQPNLSQEKKDEFKTFFRTAANIHDANLKRQRGSDARDFTNDLFSFKSSNGSYADALQKFGTRGYDATDREENKALIQKLYTKTGPSDPESKIAIYKGIESGELTDQRILRRYFLGERLSEPDYVMFSQKLYDSQTKGLDTKSKLIWDSVEEQAKTKFGSNKQKLSVFLTTLRTEAEEKKLKSRDEIQTLADKELKNIEVPAERWMMNPVRWVAGKDTFETRPSYQVSSEQIMARDRALGELKQRIGPDVAKAFGNDPEAIVKSTQALGGLDNFKVGSPMNNAVRHLGALGISPTPAAIQAVIKATNGTGVIPPNAKIVRK